jgi:hypothetical protein
MSAGVKTWRDLTGLTQAQLDRLAHREELLLADGYCPERFRPILLEDAVDHVAANIVDREQFGHIPDPAGATMIGHWKPRHRDGKWEREFQVQTWSVGVLAIDIVGVQLDDESITYEMVVYSPELRFIVPGAQALTEAITAATVELERLSGGAR